MGELAEAEPTNTKEPHIRTGPTAQPAAVPCPDGKLLFFIKFNDIRCLSHTTLY